MAHLGTFGAGANDKDDDVTTRPTTRLSRVAHPAHAAVLALAVAAGCAALTGCQSSTPLGSTQSQGSTAAGPLITGVAPSSISVAPTAAASHPVAPTTAGVAAPVPHPAPSALALLAGLAVKGRTAMTGYSRDAFGPAWADVDGDGCDTRNEVLRRDLTSVTGKNGSSCLVATGVLHDPYTGAVIDFVRGTATSAKVQIDHVVALGDAWQTGAQSWTAEQRLRFANDPAELLAVDGPTNEAKGDADAASWLPPNKAFRCQYVSLQVAVKAKYRLWVTPAEHDAIAAVLAGCSSSPGAPTRVAATPTPVTATPSGTAALAGPAVSYPNCAAVRAAGKAPLHRGDPGYSAKLDADHDGVACE